MEITIRDYTADDWSAVCRVHDRSRPDELRGSFDPRAFVRLAEDTDADDLEASEVFVAEVGDEIAGFAAFDDPYLGWLYVDPAYYRRGIGRALLRHCLERLGADAWAIACENNTAALRLYLQEGFVVEKRYRGENGGFEGPLVRIALDPEQRGWTRPTKSSLADRDEAGGDAR